MSVSNNEAKDQLRGVGLRATPSRVALLELLQICATLLGVQDILQKLGCRAPDQATVYRGLALLVATGLVNMVSLKAGVVSYEVADLPHHHHLTCERCGLVEDVRIKCGYLKPISRSRWTIREHNLEFVGVCEKCE
jgi:Fur family transcriptional regulator, ferric uptake regulator